MCIVSFFFASHHHAGRAQLHECCRSVAILTLCSDAVTLQKLCVAYCSQGISAQGISAQGISAQGISAKTRLPLQQELGVACKHFFCKKQQSKERTPPCTDQACVFLQMLDLNLQRFDGISLRVKGDGQTYKFNLKTADQMNVPESTYQEQYDTIDGEWTTVYMPWHEFVPVTRAQYDSKAKPLDPAQVKQIGLVLSRFHYNSLPNQRFKPGNFELQVGRQLASLPHSYKHT